jgi:hypothetical protein
MFDIQKEANFIKSVENYIDKNGSDMIYALVKPKSKKSIVPKVVELEPVIADKEEYIQKVNKVIEKYSTIYNAFKDKIPHVGSIIYRYEVWGFLGHISLGVHPTIKKRWGINYEMFGSFYNTNSPYNSIFSDLEPDSMGNVLSYKPESGQIVLVNPPYTMQWMIWTIRKILDEWLGKAIFYIVIPVWDCRTRKRLGLKLYNECVPEIVELIEKSKYHKVVENFLFYDGVGRKDYIMGKVPIHVIKI